MTTLVEPEATKGVPGRPDGPSRRLSRWSRWRASWRVALRMARRDVRRHKGRSILVVVMVAVPVGLLVAVACLGATEQTSPADRVQAQMGTGQALVQGPQGGPVFQSPDAMSTGSSEQGATPVPGFEPGRDNSAAVGALLGGQALPVSELEARLLEDDRRVRVSGLVLDASKADLGPKAQLTGVRWATAADEVVVTPAGVAKGLPTSGTATLSVAGTPHEVTVVGTGTALLAWGGRADFVTPTGWGAGDSSPGPMGGGQAWIVTRGSPVTWAEVLDLNRHGFTVVSASVLQHPPPESEVPPEVRGGYAFAQDTARQIAVIGGVMLFLVTTLLVAPAFAVSAARQRRTLALAASNGAETRQLRRSVLAQALLLGALAAVGGTILGVAGLWSGVRIWQRTHPGSSFASSGIDIPWTALAIILPCAVLSSLVAALIPALRLGRLDIVGVMRGQSVSPRLNRLVPAVGLALAVTGGLGLVATAKGGQEYTVAIAAFALVGGTLLTVPAVLVLCGRLASHLPVGPRMATRDAARHRSRSTPTVAAILAGASILTIFSIALASDTRQAMRDYRPQAIHGEGAVSTTDPEGRLAARAALEELGGGLVSTPVRYARNAGELFGPTPESQSTPQPFVAALGRGCSVQDAVGDPQDGVPYEQCHLLGSNAYNSGDIAILPASEIARRLGLTASQRTALEDGAIAVAQPGLSTLPTLTMASGTYVVDPQAGVTRDITQKARAVLPVVAVPASTMRDGRMLDNVGAMVADTTATRLGWPATEVKILIRDPGGDISPETEQALDERLGDEGGVYVERGFQRYDETVTRVMFGVAAALLLVVTLISTALSMAEQQADMGTFAAVGATRGTRRRLAASQAVVVSLVGALLGVAVGLAPGIAVSHPLTSSGGWDPVTGQQVTSGATTVIPWLPLLLVVLCVPLAAAVLSAAAIRRAPTVTRRAD